MGCLALVRGLLVTTTLGFTQIDVETDALGVINVLGFDNFHQAPFGNLIEDIRCVASRLVGTHFRFVPQECNRVAHFLAKSAERYRKATVWVGLRSVSCRCGVASFERYCILIFIMKSFPIKKTKN